LNLKYGLTFFEHRSIISEKMLYMIAHCSERMMFTAENGQSLKIKANQYLAIEQSSGFHFVIDKSLFKRVFPIVVPPDARRISLSSGV